MLIYTPLKQVLTSFLDWLPFDISSIIPSGSPEFLYNLFVGSDGGEDQDGNWVINLYINGVVETQIPLFSDFLLRLGNDEIPEFGKVELKLLNNAIPGIGFYGEIALVIPNSILKPIEDINRKTIITLGGTGILVNNVDISLESNINITLEKSFIGNSNIVVELENFSYRSTNGSPEFVFEKGTVSLPESFIIPDGTEIILKDAKISSTGFSGSCSVDVPLLYDGDKNFSNGTEDATIFGIPGGLKHVEIVIENNIPTTFNLEGQLLVPYFEKPVDVLFKIDDNGDVTATIKSVENELPLIKDDLIALYIQSLQFKKDGEEGSFTISGGIEPLLFSKDGIKWPRLDVKNFKISSDGKISIDEAWLDLKDIVNLNLWGFHFEVRKIGFGTSQDDKLWIDISGGVKLIEQIPLGLDVEGFRITWPRELNLSAPDLISELQKIEIRFAGVEINIATPGVMKIDGLIRFMKEAQKVGFAGDMKLAVIPAGFTAEAGLMVGMNFDSPAYPFLYVYFGFESSAGIPLAQTGLALKGAMGLIGMNVAPNKTPEQNWFYDWYKGPPAPGVHQTTKWTDKRDAFAIGIGVTISTADGVVKSTKGLIVLAVPGPILVIEGKAIILNPSGEGEGPFGALAVFDGNAGTVQFNIEAQAELVKDMLEASAGVEAFFDFNDITNWHLYLGKDEPYSRRIQANVMDIMTADAYLMMDMVDADSPRARMGVTAKIEPKIPPLKYDVSVDLSIGIDIDAWLKIGGDGYASINPDQFSGGVHIDGELSISAFGIEFGISGKATAAFEGPRPFSLQGDVEFGLDFPWPVPDYHGQAHFELKIPAVNLVIKDSIQTVSLFSRFTNESKKSLKYESGSEDLEAEIIRAEIIRAENSIVVPVDAKPIIDFDHEMNFNGDNFLMHPGGTKTYSSGKIELTPELLYVKIYEKKKSEPWDVDNLWGNEIFSTKAYDSTKLFGVWLTESNPQNPGIPTSRKLLLFNDSPVANTALSFIMLGAMFYNENVIEHHLSELLIQDYPGLMFEPPAPPKDRCLTFYMYSENEDSREHLVEKFIGGQDHIFQSLKLRSNKDFYIGSFEVKSGVCLGIYAQGNLEITFPEDVVYCSIEYCSQHIPENIKKSDDIIIEEPSEKEDSKNPKDPKKGKGSMIKYLLSEISMDEEIKIGDYESNIWSGYKPIESNNSAERKKSYDKIVMLRDNIIITSLCYRTKKDYDDYETARDIYQNNQDFSFDESNLTPLNPGCYYKIISKTSVHATKKGDVFLEPYGDALEKEFGSRTEGTREFTDIFYFQTEAPPNNLLPYIKWTYPNQEMNRVFCDAQFNICFKRDYMRKYFGGLNGDWKNFEIMAYVEDSNNKLTRYNTTWENSNSITLFPDELTWEIHKIENQINSDPRKENILRISSLPPFELLRNQRYNLLLTGGDGGKILIPSKLEETEMSKHWEYNISKWMYDSDSKELRNIYKKGEKFLSVKNDYDNIEVVFEINGDGVLDFIFRYKKFPDGKEIYYGIKFDGINKPVSKLEKGFNKLTKKVSSPQKVSFYLTDSNKTQTIEAELILDLVKYNELEWKKYKIRIIGNLVKLFCFEESILKEVDGFDLAKLYTEDKVNNLVKMENNVLGSVGFKKIGSGPSKKFPGASIKTSYTVLRNIGVKSSELLRIPFYSTGFKNRTEMFKPMNDNATHEMKIIEIEEAIGETIVNSGFRDLYESVAANSLAFYKTSIDYEYGMAKYEVGNEPILYDREAVEKYRLNLRNAKKAMDELFNAEILKLVGGEFFTEAKEGLNIFGLKKNDELLYIYIKSPENLYMKYNNGIDSGIKDPYARTNLDIKVNGVVQNVVTIFNSDGNQLLLILENEVEIEELKKNIEFDFSYTKNFNDEDTDFFEATTSSNVKHHRYDRPFIFKGGSTLINAFILIV